MKTVIKLGGCNGSGKTTLAHAVMDAARAMPRTWDGTRKSPNHYVGKYADRPVMVLGSYATACGGMDTISDKEERLAMIKWAVDTAPDRAIIFFEGLMTGKTYGAIGAYSEAVREGGQAQFLYAFLDTPFEECAARVLARRKAAGNLNPFDPCRTMLSTFTAIEQLREKLLGTRVGRTPIPTYHPVMTLQHKAKPATLAKQLLDRAVKLGG